MARDTLPSDERETRHRDYSFVLNEEERNDLKWLGLGPGASYGVPQVYDPHEDVIYEGEVDEDAERVRVNEEERRELDEDETLGDHVESMAEDHGWTWLSDFAHDHLETTDHDADLDVIHSRFDKRNVRDSADYDLGYFGSYTYRDEDGHVHTLERRFDVYTDGNDRTETGTPLAVVEETLLSAEAPNEERRAGDAELDDERVQEITLDVGPDANDAEIQAACKRWHEANPEPTVTSIDRLS